MHGTAPKAITFTEAYELYRAAQFRLVMMAKREITARLAHLYLRECELVLIGNKLHLDNAKFKAPTYTLDAAGYREAQALIQDILDRLSPIALGLELPLLWVVF
jgi:hypothetical protein